MTTFNQILQQNPSLLSKETYKKTTIPEKPKDPELEAMSKFELLIPCEHNNFNQNCLECDYFKYYPTTDHEVAKTLYIKFSVPMRTSYNDESNTPEQLKKHYEDLDKNGKTIVWRKQAGYYDTLLYILDHAVDRFPSDSEIRIINFLASKYFKTNRAIEPLTEHDLRELENQRKHVFKWQVSKIQDRIKWIVKFKE